VNGKQATSIRFVLVGLGLGVLVGAAQEAPVQEPAAVGETEVIARYREAAETSDRPIDHYNLGTALLLEGQVSDAQTPLQQALRSEREVVRESGQYNYGLSTAFDGRFAQQDPTARRSAFVAARQAFREVLRTRPEDADARWNLELVDRWLQEDEQSGGDGSEGGQADSQGGSGAGGAPAGNQGEDQMLSPEEAAALLDQAGDAEASIRDRVMGRNRFKEPVVEKNW
jgi:tetratricopeptide (TPR) repeat protein